MNPTSSVDIIYPESDGKPMAESDVHRDWMVRLIDLLKHRFTGQRVYVSGNLLIYYVEGDPKRCVAPDVFVVKDCDPRPRKIYKLWEEGKGPDFILETTSSSTRREDLVHKARLFAQLKVAEYFLYDPLGEWLELSLLAYRLVGGGYIPLEPERESGIFSEQLGITFRLEDGRLALFNGATGERLRTGAELTDEAQTRAAELQLRLTEAAARLVEAEAQVTRDATARRALEDELAKLRAKSP